MEFLLNSCPVLACFGCHTKYHRLDVLNSRNLFFYSSGGWKVLQSSDLGRALLLAFRLPLLLCAHRKGSRGGGVSSSYKAPVLPHKGPNP